MTLQKLDVRLALVLVGALIAALLPGSPARAANVTAQVQTPDGSPAGEVYVDVYDPSGWWVDGGYGSSGEVSFALEDGDYEFVASDGQWPEQFEPSERVSVSVSGGVASPDPVVLSLRAANVTAQVQTPDGSPAGEVSVDVYDASSGDFVDNGYGSSGEVSFALGDGDYEFVASDGQWPEQFGPSERVSVSVSGGVASPDPVVLSLRVPNVTAQVQTPDGSPAGEVYVTVYDATSGDWVDNGYGSSGEVTFLLDDGDYELVANDGQDPQQYESSEPVAVSVSGGVASPDLVSLTLRAPTLTAQVLEPDGSPAGMVDVDVYDTSGSRVASKFGDAGEVTFLLDDGDYELVASDAAPKGLEPSEPVAVSVSGGVASLDPVVLSLRAPNVTAQVQTPDGSPAGEVYVDVYDTAGEWVDGASGPSGEVTFLLDDGDYEFVASDGRWPEQFEPSTAVAVTVSGGVATPDPVELALRAPNVTAQVLNPDGSTAGDVRVEVYDASGNYVTGGYGTSGEATFLLDDGNYEFVASDSQWPQQYEPSTAVAVTVSGGVATPDPVELALRAPNVTAQVLNPDGSTAGDVRVEVYDASGNYVTGDYGTSGEVTFLLDDGDYEIVADDDQWPRQFGESLLVAVSVSGGVATPDPVELTLRTPNVTAQVLNPDGSTAGEVYVDAYDTSGNYVAGGYGTSGEVTLLLDDGDYELIAGDDQWPRQFGESLPVAVSVSGGVATPDPVELTLRTPNVTAQVLNPDGSTAGEVYVDAYDTSGSWVDGAYSSSGEIEFLLEDGDYELVASDPGGSYGPSIRVPVTVSGTTVSPSPVVLELREMTIVGGVEAANGDPGSYLCVYAFPSPQEIAFDDAVTCSGTDPAGSFSMFLEDGSYWLQAKAYTTSAGNGGYSSSLVEVTVVDGVADVPSPMLTLQMNPNLTGTVDLGGADVSDVDWRVYRREDRGAYDDLLMVDGAPIESYPLATWLADGDYEVQAHIYPWTGNGWANSQLTGVQVQGGTADPSDVALALRPAGTVQGSVVDAATGQAPDGCVQVYQYEDGARTATSAKANDAGQYELSVGAGEQTIGVGACSSYSDTQAEEFAQQYVWDLQWFGGSSTLDGASPVQVTAGEATTANFTLGDHPEPQPAKPELLSFHPSNGSWWMTEVSTDGTPTKPTLLTTYGTKDGWQTHLAADMTGDGKPELLSFHPSNGTWWMTEVSTDGTPTKPTLLTTYGTKSGWQTHLAADMTGDGKPELLSFHPSNGTWWMTEVSTDGTPTKPTLLTTYGTKDGWQTHLAADMTGDGKPELLSFHPSNGTWWMTEVSTDGTPTKPTLLTTYGTKSGWQTHLAADMTGDGKPELLSFHPSNGTWWMTEVSTDGTPTKPTLLTTYGTKSGWQTHLAADMTGDGKPELLSFHPSNGTWWMTEVSTDGTPTKPTLLTTYGTKSGWQTHLAADMTGPGG